MKTIRYANSETRGFSSATFHRCCRFALALSIGAAALTASSAIAGDQTRPMGGSCNTVFAFTGPDSSRYEGTCHLLHLGLSRVIAVQKVSFNPDGTLGIVDVATYIAANGDELQVDFQGTGKFVSPTEVSFIGIETYHGGEGRFADATGSAVVSGRAQFTSATGGTGEYVSAGTISY